MLRCELCGRPAPEAQWKEGDEWGFRACAECRTYLMEGGKRYRIVSRLYTLDDGRMRRVADLVRELTQEQYNENVVRILSGYDGEVPPCPEALEKHRQKPIVVDDERWDASPSGPWHNQELQEWGLIWEMIEKLEMLEPCKLQVVNHLINRLNWPEGEMNAYGPLIP